MRDHSGSTEFLGSMVLSEFERGVRRRFETRIYILPQVLMHFADFGGKGTCHIFFLCLASLFHIRYFALKYD